jgi:hypothetical protein
MEKYQVRRKIFRRSPDFTVFGEHLEILGIFGGIDG